MGWLETGLTIKNHILGTFYLSAVVAALGVESRTKKKHFLGRYQSESTKYMIFNNQLTQDKNRLILVLKSEGKSIFGDSKMIQIIVKVYVRSDKVDQFPLYPTSLDSKQIARHVERMVVSFYGRNVRYEFGAPTIEDGVL